MAPRGNVGVRPQPRKLGEVCLHHSGGLQWSITSGVVRMSDGGDYPQGERHQLQRNWPGGCPVEGDIRNHQSPDIVFHPVYDALHGFRARRGTGTATLEENLLQKIIAVRYTVLHSILLNLSKA